MRYVALLRGINVGGHKKLPMAELRALASGLGYGNVATYIQSGNLFVDSKDSPALLARKVHDAIEAEFGYDVPTLVRSATDIDKAIAAHPFTKVAKDEKHLAVGFLSSAPTPKRVAALGPAVDPGEEFAVIDRTLYLHLPHGTGKSKMMTYDFARHLGVDVTVRNWRTVKALAANLASR